MTTAIKAGGEMDPRTVALYRRVYATPPGSSERQMMVSHLRGVVRGLANDMFGDAMFSPLDDDPRPAPAIRRLILRVLKKIITRNFRHLADATGAEGSDRADIAHAATLGWCEFREALQVAMADVGGWDRGEIAARLAATIAKA